MLTFWKSAKERLWLACAMLFIASTSAPLYLRANLPLTIACTSSALEKWHKCQTSSTHCSYKHTFPSTQMVHKKLSFTNQPLKLIFFFLWPSLAPHETQKLQWLEWALIFQNVLLSRPYLYIRKISKQKTVPPFKV